MRRNAILISLLCVLSLAFPASARDIIRILAIGNSFSEDAVEQNLTEIARSEGVDVMVANLYVAACSVDMHYENLTERKAVYRYRKISPEGKMTERNNVLLQTALKDEKWDYISFQQSSAESGEFGTLGRLPELMRQVRAAVGERPKFVWHQTWAYSSRSTHAGFEAYGRNQLQMYHKIAQTSRLVMETYPEISIIIPCGTAIQDARTAIIAGDDLTRDGYHLEKNTARYIAACTWFSALFRRILSADCYAPADMSARFRKIAHEAAHEAVLHPYTIVRLPVAR